MKCGLTIVRPAIRWDSSNARLIPLVALFAVLWAPALPAGEA